MTLSKFVRDTKRIVSKHSPEILTGIGVAGMITSTILAVKATPKALKLMEDAQHDKKEDLTVKEKAKAIWKCYIPSVSLTLVSAGCLFGANSVNMKRNAALATAYKLSETALSEYKETIVEELGEEKAKDIREKVAQKKIDNTTQPKSEVVIVGDSNKVWFFEPISTSYFQSEVETIKRAINDLNYRMISGMEEYVTLKEFYNEIGVKYTEYTPDLGWNLYSEGKIEVEMVATKMENGNPCLMLDYEVPPRYNPGYID